MRGPSSLIDSLRCSPGMTLTVTTTALIVVAIVVGATLQRVSGLGMGLVVARTVVNYPAALALLALPTILIVVAYRAYTGAKEQQDNLRLMH